MTGYDVWDSIEYTPEIKATVDKLINSPDIRIERRGETTYYPGRLFVKNEKDVVSHHKVIVADQKDDDFTVISMEFIRRHQDTVLVMRVGDGLSSEYEGSIVSTRPGKRTGDSDMESGKVKRFIAGFKPIQ